MKHPKYKYLDHTGDIGLEAWGESLSELFLNAAYGMLDLLYERGKLANIEERVFEVDAEDVELLLVEWLSELKYLNYEFLTKDIIIDKIETNRVICKIYGEIYNQSKHEIIREIKNVTYHGLKVEELDDGVYHATVIFDV